MREWERTADTANLVAAALSDAGLWIAGMAPWSSMLTLTHGLVAGTSSQPLTRRGHRSGHGSYTRVGLNAHNALVRRWFFDVVRPSDRSAQLWSETELHESGQPHEHSLIAHAANAPVYSWLDAWYRMPRGGIWHRLPFSQDPDVAVRAACYVEKAAKYVGKMASQPPKIFGFGLAPAPSFARVLL